MKEVKLETGLPQLSIPMPEHISAMRHGESEENVLHKQLDNISPEGWDPWVKSFWRYEQFVMNDWGLTERGKEEVACVAREEIAKYYPRPDVLLVSPYIRAQQSTDIVVPICGWEDIPRITVNELLEWQWGCFIGGMRPDPHDSDTEIGRIFREKNPLIWKPLGGESIFDIAHGRLFNLLMRLSMSPYKRPFCITHGGIMFAMRFLLEGLDRVQFRSIFHAQTRNCEILSYSRTKAGTAKIERHYVPPASLQSELSPTRTV